MIENGLRKTVVAAGTIFIEHYSDQKVANIGELMVSKSYSDPTELVTQMLSCLESIAWFNDCSQIVLEGFDFVSNEDVALNLGYLEHMQYGNTYFAKFSSDE